jgi:RNA polymerase sigma-70 factor (ECF subfamily)
MAINDADALDRADMQQLQAGDDDALNRLMTRHANPVASFIFRMVTHESDAEELAQETFVRLYRARDSYRPEARFTTWLFTIAANLARNELRRRARHPNISLDAPNDHNQNLADRLPTDGQAPDQVLTTEERHAQVRAAVAKLPEDLRDALVLCEWEEMSMAEAADVLKTTAKAVESRLYRARKELRSELRRWL